MVGVWTLEGDKAKNRACVAGNFEAQDPTSNHWTAQAEPGTLTIGLKLARDFGWEVSKHIVSGAFLNAHVDELVVVRPHSCG